MKPFAAIFGVAVLLAWPALVNGYPILFSDTHAFLIQASQPRMVWDKPWVYGPFMLAWHGRTSLWLVVVGQALIVSHLLWLVAGADGPWRHVVLGVVLAVGSAAPWFVSLLMPDIFAPIVVLGMYLLAAPGGLGRWQIGWVGALTWLAIAVHLSHLVVAGAVLVVVGLVWPRRVGVVALPLVGALVFLVGSNVVGYGRFAVSPYGANFALARLTADGLTGPVLEAACPASGWHLCGWRGRLPPTSDGFLWDGDGPVWTAPGGPAGFAPEAGAIVAAVVVADPGLVLKVALRNTAVQLVWAGVGDTLGPDWLEGSVTNSLAEYFPAPELRRFRAGLQARDELSEVAMVLAPGAVALLLAGTVMTLFSRPRGFAAVIVVGLLANAFATGALSGPHGRYQARIAWLVLLPPVLGWLIPTAVDPRTPRSIPTIGRLTDDVRKRALLF